MFSASWGQEQKCHIVSLYQKCHNVAIVVNKKIIAKYKKILYSSVVKLPFG